MYLFSHACVKCQLWKTFFTHIRATSTSLHGIVRTIYDERTMILVKNAKIVDGSGTAMRRGDALISGGSISAVGNFPSKKADIVIEGLGMHLAPGFVDIHSHIDHTLAIFRDPASRTIVKEGVTTVIGGNDGVSLAPRTGGSLGEFRKWGGETGMNVDWQTMAEFKGAMARLPLGINFATFAGYATARKCVTKRTRGDLTDKELDAVMGFLEDAMDEGAMGISLDLGSAEGRSISHEEARRAAQAVAGKKCVLALNLRGHENRAMEAAQEAVALYRSTGASIIVRDFVPHEPTKQDEREFMVAYESMRNAGDHLWVELPHAKRRLCPIRELLPHRFKDMDDAEKNALVRDKKARKELVRELPRIPDGIIASAPKEHKQLIGMTLETFARNRDMEVKAGIVELMRISGMKASLFLPAKRSHLAESLMGEPQVLFAGSPEAFFEAADHLRWPIEKTIAKLSGIPAKALGIGKRGLIRENWKADLVLVSDTGEVAHAIVNGKYAAPGGTFIAT